MWWNVKIFKRSKYLYLRDPQWLIDAFSPTAMVFIMVHHAHLEKSEIKKYMQGEPMTF